MTNQEKLAIIRSRLRDYEKEDIAGQRAKLVALWQQAYPDAVNEVSIALHPLIMVSRRVPDDRPDDPDEYWINDVYHVTLRRKEEDPVFGSRGGMIQLGINAHDGTARHDWREFQAIKNQLAGPECESFELYPKESRLMDPSNYYSIWCFPGVKLIKVGINQGRRVWNADEALAPQRAF